MSCENPDNGHGFGKGFALTTLDINVVHHCNLRCANCSHGSPFAKKYIMGLDVMEKDLWSISPVLHVDEILIVGGEPLLRKDIPNIISTCRDSHVADNIVIVTNGILLSKIDYWDALENVKIRVSCYPGVNRAEIENVLRQHTKNFVIHNYDKFYAQFRKTKDSFYRCKWKNQCMTLHEGFLYKCPQSCFWPDRFFKSTRKDGLALDRINEDKLHNFMHSSEPLETCLYCDASEKKVAWKQSNTYEEWLKDSTW